VTVALVTTSCGTSNATVDLAKDRVAANEAIRAQDCDRAVATLDRIISADPADLVSRHARANCLLALQRLTQAIADFQYITSNNPTAQGYLELAQAEWSAGQTQAAIAALRKASSLTTANPLLFDIASTQRAYGDVSAALETLQNVPSVNRDFRWYIELGRIDAIRADTSYVDRDFTKALANAPVETRGSVLAAWGDARWFQGRYQAALGTYAQALAAGKGVDFVHVYTQLADSSTKLGDLAQAVTYYRAALNSNPSQDAWENLNLGLAGTLLKQHQTAEASAILREILSSPRASDEGKRKARAMQLLVGS
jgi:tetratricopeptide (TPR) repeat protein